MTTEELKQHAKRVHDVIEKHPALKTLFDLAHEESIKPDDTTHSMHMQTFIMIGFDLMACDIEMFEAL